MLFDKSVAILFVLTISSPWIPGNGKSGQVLALKSVFIKDPVKQADLLRAMVDGILSQPELRAEIVRRLEAEKRMKQPPTYSPQFPQPTGIPMIKMIPGSTDPNSNGKVYQFYYYYPIISNSGGVNANFIHADGSQGNINSNFGNTGIPNPAFADLGQMSAN